jgi:hypothetical protein
MCGEKMLYLRLSWVLVVILRNVNSTLNGNCLYLVPYRVEMSTCATVEQDVAMSGLVYICVGEALTFQFRHEQK